MSWLIALFLPKPAELPMSRLLAMEAAMPLTEAARTGRTPSLAAIR